MYSILQYSTKLQTIIDTGKWLQLFVGILCCWKFNFRLEDNCIYISSLPLQIKRSMSRVSLCFCGHLSIHTFCNTIHFLNLVHTLTVFHRSTAFSRMCPQIDFTRSNSLLMSQPLCSICFYEYCAEGCGKLIKIISSIFFL